MMTHFRDLDIFLLQSSLLDLLVYVTMCILSLLGVVYSQDKQLFININLLLWCYVLLLLTDLICYHVFFSSIYLTVKYFIFGIIGKLYKNSYKPSHRKLKYYVNTEIACSFFKLKSWMHTVLKNNVIHYFLIINICYLLRSAVKLISTTESTETDG